MTINYRLFDLEKETNEVLFQLYKETYGDENPYRKRWDWEYDKNPRKKDLRIIVAESNGQIIGATTRLPITIKYEDRIINSAFSVNSMVHPNFRRMGVMDHLYHKGSELYDILFSKGTMPGMYKLIMKMGYKSVKPDTYMTALLSPLKWVFWKFRLYKSDTINSNSQKSNKKTGEYRLVDIFEDDFDEFYNRCLDSHEWVGIIKDHDYMNWRYIRNPFKSYKIFYRKKSDTIVSMVVLRSEGITGKLVDFIWDKNQIDEPDHTIKFIKKYFKKNGLLKATCWTLIEELRIVLKKNGFFERTDFMNLSKFSKFNDYDLFNDKKTFAFVEGDSDVEYIS